MLEAYAASGLKQEAFSRQLDKSLQFPIPQSLAEWARVRAPARFHAGACRQPSPQPWVKASALLRQVIEMTKLTGDKRPGCPYRDYPLAGSIERLQAVQVFFAERERRPRQIPCRQGLTLHAVPRMVATPGEHVYEFMGDHATEGTSVEHF